MKIIIIGLIALFGFYPLSNAIAQSNVQESPNFIIIFTDDLGYGDVASAGSDLIQTPHIDRMEKEGVRLTNHFSSSNVCTPSRAGLLTGRYPIRSGLAHQVLFPDSEHGLPHEEITSVRSQRWKFVVRSYYRGGLARFEGERRGEPHYYHPGLLFDLNLNPEEQFSYTRENSEIVEKMIKKLEKGRSELEVLGRHYEE